MRSQQQLWVWEFPKNGACKNGLPNVVMPMARTPKKRQEFLGNPRTEFGTSDLAIWVTAPPPPPGKLLDSQRLEVASVSGFGYV